MTGAGETPWPCWRRWRRMTPMKSSKNPLGPKLVFRPEARSAFVDEPERD
jgi:hypothetical protein